MLDAALEVHGILEANMTVKFLRTLEKLEILDNTMEDDKGRVLHPIWLAYDKYVVRRGRGN